LWISSITLENFRNYEQLDLVLAPGITLFHGENGEGKTNLIEAVGFLSTLSSHRVSGYQPLISNAKETSQFSLRLNHEKRVLLIAAELNRSGSNRYFVNGNQKRRTSEIVGTLKTVVFAPEDLDIIRRDPQDRRSFLDTAMVQLKPRLSGVKSDYDRVLKQRNALLKSAKSTKNPDLSTLDIWDDQLVAFGADLILSRIQLVSDLEPLLNSFYQELSAKSELVTLFVQSSILGQNPEDGFIDLSQSTIKDIRDLFHDQIASLRTLELDRGITLVGPHRDELKIELGTLAARSHASQGEAWSLALGLKLAQAELIRRDSQQGDPVLILDDVYSVLDAGRRERLTRFVAKNEQVLITSADLSVAPDLKWSAIHEVSGGKIVAKVEL
jgi:DNA replication and repair protein RecF